MRSTVPSLSFHDIPSRNHRDRTERQAEQGRHASRHAREPADIETVVNWTYQQQRAHRSAPGDARERAWLVGGGGCDYSRPIVQGGGAGAFDLHPDAELVHHLIAVHRLHLLAEYGRMADRPDWRPGARPRCEPLLDGAGLPKIHREWSKTKKVQSEWCPVRYLDDPQSVAVDRDRYRAWRSGLVTLAGLVVDRLQRWRVTGPSAPVAPWLDKAMSH